MKVGIIYKAVSNSRVSSWNNDVTYITGETGIPPPDSPTYTLQRRRYGSPTQRATRIKNEKMRERERTTDSERHIQYGRRWTQIRNYRLPPRGHQRNIGRKPTNGIVGLAGHRTGPCPRSPQKNLRWFEFGTRQNDSSDESEELFQWQQSHPFVWLT